MMRVEIENNKLDLGTTPIENMFINTYLSDANDVQIKVYLYALSNAYNGNNDISNENIAKEMNLTTGQVVDSWDYWVKQGVVEISKEGVYKFKSVRYEYIKAISTIDFDESDNDEFNVEIKSKNEDISNSSTKEMFDNIESLLSENSSVPIKLNAREIKVIMELKDTFNLSEDFVSYAYTLASNIRGMKGVDPIVATIRNWVIDGATDMEKLDSYLESKEKSKENNKNSNSGNSEKDKDSLYKKDERMTKSERDKFIEEKLKRKLPIGKRK